MDTIKRRDTQKTTIRNTGNTADLWSLLKLYNKQQLGEIGVHFKPNGEPEEFDAYKVFKLVKDSYLTVEQLVYYCLDNPPTGLAGETALGLAYEVMARWFVAKTTGIPSSSNLAVSLTNAFCDFVGVDYYNILTQLGWEKNQGTGFTNFSSQMKKIQEVALNNGVDPVTFWNKCVDFMEEN